MKLSELFEQNGFDLGNLKESFGLIDGISEHIIAESDEVLAKQHQISENIYFLIKGKATFTKYFETKSITFAKITKPATPLGISGLNQPNRFMGEIFIEGGTEYISIKLNDLRDLQQKNSKLISTLYSAISFFSFQLLVSSRNLNTLYKDDEIQISPGIPSEKSITNIHRIKSATFFSTLTDDDLEKFIKLGNIKMYSSNQYIVKEGDVSKGLKILLSGKVDGLFHNFINGKIRRNFRTLTRARIALTLSSGKGDFFNPYTIKSTRDTKVLHISNEALENLIISDPELSIKIFKRQLWQLGRFQQSATGLTKYSAENELEFVNLLLKDNTARIPASSKLYSIPHLLKSTHTYAMAFDVVYELLIKGNEIEKLPTPKDFYKNILESKIKPGVIAEIKKASPSKGVIRKDFNPENIAICYEGLGASCISVLTDKRFFQGSYEILETVRRSTNLPLLCKDFIISAYQIYKARVSGADAILLIAAILSDDDLIYLKKIADNLKMSVLVEVHNSNELERILKLKSFNLIGINNRDLKTFKTDLKTSIELMNIYADIFLKQNILPISESGINCAEDLESLRSIGIKGVLIGETFMRETDIEKSFKKLFNSI